MFNARICSTADIPRLESLKNQKVLFTCISQDIKPQSCALTAILLFGCKKFYHRYFQCKEGCELFIAMKAMLFWHFCQLESRDCMITYHHCGSSMVYFIYLFLAFSPFGSKRSCHCFSLCLEASEHIIIATYLTILLQIDKFFLIPGIIIIIVIMNLIQ